MKLLTMAFVLAIGGPLVIASASCARSINQAAPKDDNSNVLDSGISGDGSNVDAACDGSADGCTDGSIACDDADFCPTSTGADPRYALTAVWGSSKNDVWAVGSQGTILHWDGAAWTATPSGTKQSLFAVTGTGPGDVWAVSSRDVALHSTGFAGGGATWTKAPPLAPVYAPYAPQPWNESLLLSAWARAPGDIWVGGEPYPVLVDPDTPPKSSNLWRSADGGTVWENDGIAEHFAVRGLWAAGTGDVWAVGAVVGTTLERAGRAFHTMSGASGAPVWTERDTQSTAALLAVWGSSANDVWAVGERGTVRHWTNGPLARWEIITVPTTHDLRAVWGTGPTDVWVAGDAGTILHYDGAAWTPAVAAFPVGVRPHLRGIWGSAADDVWVVGDGIALHLEARAGRAP